jgi:hypothetical protein
MYFAAGLYKIFCAEFLPIIYKGYREKQNIGAGLHNTKIRQKSAQSRLLRGF